MKHFAPLFEAEERHFWFRARNRCISAITSLIRNRESVRDVIEHGCGTGFVLCELQRLFPKARLTGADLFPEALAFARQRFAGPLLQVDIMECKYREAFDLIGLFDVLEHLNDDIVALEVLRKQLRSGGFLLLTVPAHKALWSGYDVASGHRRRYTRPELVERLAQAGFRVEFCTEFMFALLPLMLLHRRLMSRVVRYNGTAVLPESEMKKELSVSPALNRLFESILRPEVWWISHRRRLPAGTSIIALASRQSD